MGPKFRRALLAGAVAVSVVLFAGCTGDPVRNDGQHIYVSLFGEDSNDGTSPQSPKLSLQAGIDAAAPGYTVCVSGDYAIEAPWDLSGLSNVVILGGWDPDFLSQGSPSVIIADGTHSVVMMTNSALVTLSNFVITGGGGVDYGGGIFITNACNSHFFCVITGNEALLSGGGVYLSGGTNNIFSGSISANIVNFRGGGVYLDRTSYNIFRAVVSGNSAGVSGGGFYLDRSDINTFSGAITENRANSDGGGLFLEISSGNLFSSNCLIRYNRCDSDSNGSGDGGGIHVSGGIGNSLEPGAAFSPNFKGSGTTVTNDLTGITGP